MLSSGVIHVPEEIEGRMGTALDLRNHRGGDEARPSVLDLDLHRLVDEARTFHAGEPVRRLKAIKSGWRAGVQMLAAGQLCACVYSTSGAQISACAAAFEENAAAAAGKHSVY